MRCWCEIVLCLNRVFHTLYKLGRNGYFVFKGFNNSKKNYLQWGSTWCYRLLLTLFRSTLNNSHAYENDWVLFLLINFSAVLKRKKTDGVILDFVSSFNPPWKFLVNSPSISMLFCKGRKVAKRNIIQRRFFCDQMLTAGVNVSPRFIWDYLLLKETWGRILMTSGTEHFTPFMFLFATFHKVSSRKDNVDNHIRLFSNCFIIVFLIFLWQSFLFYALSPLVHEIHYWPKILAAN